VNDSRSPRRDHVWGDLDDLYTPWLLKAQATCTGYFDCLTQLVDVEYRNLCSDEDGDNFPGHCTLVSEPNLQHTLQAIVYGILEYEINLKFDILFILSIFRHLGTIDCI
jgi:hypothetical protein